VAEPLDGGVSERAKVRNTAAEAHEWAGMRRMPLGLLTLGRKPRSVVFLLDGKPVGAAGGFVDYTGRRLRSARGSYALRSCFRARDRDRLRSSCEHGNGARHLAVIGWLRTASNARLRRIPAVPRRPMGD